MEIQFVVIPNCAEALKILQVIAYALWNLMAGFIIPKPRVPGWWIWLLYLTPTHWSFYVRGSLSDSFPEDPC